MMAARLNPKHDARTREKIKTSQLINRLNSFVLGGSDPKTKKPIEMAPHQVTAALGLLKKVLPDLQATTIDANVETRTVARMPTVNETADEWQNQHSPTLQ